jgi:FkbM family methyltransferase
MQTDQRAKGFAILRNLFGLRSALYWYLIRLTQVLGIAEPKQWKVRPRQVRYPLTARLGESSDMCVLYQVFHFAEYASLQNLQNVELVLDLGANVGYTSAYFLNCFPKCRIIAVEPDERNVKVLESNLRPYGKRTKIVHGAVWSERTALRLSKGTFGDGREWATQVLPAENGRTGEVEAWDVGSLIGLSGNAGVDLLKIDIEGAELGLFGGTAKSWLPKVRNLCIELHGPECEKVFFNSLVDYDYELEHSGELTICRNLSLKYSATVSGREDHCAGTTDAPRAIPADEVGIV